MTLQEIIKQCVLARIPVSIVLEPESVDGLAYEVVGFAKSGLAKVFVSVNGNILVHTRYHTVDTIESFEGLASVCYGWCLDYIDRGYSYGEWAGTFERLGWIKSKTATTTTWERA